MMRRPLIVATGNPGKLVEFRTLLADLPFDIRSLGQLGIASPEETGASFLENALLKARHAAAAAELRGAPSPGCAAIADDSGLEVDALGGAPGIFSARFAGLGADDAANNAKLRSALAGVPAGQRRARYRCVLAFVAGADDTAPLIAEGTWEGLILDAPRRAVRAASAMTRTFGSRNSVSLSRNSISTRRTGSATAAWPCATCATC